MQALVNSLSESEKAIVRETERKRLQDLDEDALMDLHARVRRARDKYVKLYRREAAANVEDLGGRGVARPRSRHNAGRAEVFEDALARVSRYLAIAARRTANALRAERIAAARRSRGTGPAKDAAAHTPGAMTDQLDDRAPDSPALRKQHASTLAEGARRQAGRDGRRATKS